MTNHTTPKTCGYTTLKNDCFEKLCRQSTVTSDQTCAYRRKCKHNLKLKHKLIFGPSSTTVSSSYVYKHQKCI